MIEIWKDIKDYEGLYQVSNLGTVKGLGRLDSKGRIVNGKILKSSLNADGYPHLSLCKNGKCMTRKIHQLVAESFLGHKRCGMELVINHIDFDKSNNNINNLEIVTNRENSNKKKLKGTSQYPGVYWHKYSKKWHARIRIKNTIKNLGLFIDEIEASKAYQNELLKIK